MCDDGWQQGWHERNGGNLSYRLRPEEAVRIQPDAGSKRDRGQRSGVSVPGLAKEFFMVTGSGKYFRNVILNPEIIQQSLRLMERASTTAYAGDFQAAGGRPVNCRAT